MSQWHVELFNEREELLSFLATALQEQLFTIRAGSNDCYYINPGAEPRLAAQKTSGYYLLSSEFESLKDDQVISDLASELLTYLNALIKLKISAFAPPLEKGGVYRLDAEGRLIWELAFVSATLSTLASKLQNASRQSLNFTDIWLLAQKHPKVEEALRQLANETNWFNLYKIYEIIEIDVGKKTLDTWTHGKNEDFTYSANNAHASQYAALHSSAKFSPSHKRKSMAPSEGAEFITSLFLQWLQTK